MKRSTLIAVASLLWLATAQVTLHAQRNTTPGLPWTYVVEDSIPDYATGPVWDSLEREIRGLYDTLGGGFYEIRYIYRVRFHPHLATILPGDSITVEVPRDPGVSERVTLGTAYKEQRVIRNGSHTYETGWFLSGFRSRDRPELRAAEMNLSEFDRRGRQPSSLDTGYNGDLNFFPSYYKIFGNGLRGSEHDDYGYIIQFVDDVWAPRVSSVADDRRVERALSAYPNPARGREVTVDMPDDWGSVPLTARVYGPDGALLGRSSRDPGARQRVALDADWPPGVYHVAFYRDGGRVAVARFVR